MSHAFLLYEMQGIVAGQIQEFVKFPPRQKPASFNLDAVMAQLSSAVTEHRDRGTDEGSSLD